MVKDGFKKLYSKRSSYKVRIFRSILLLIICLVLIFGLYTYYDYLQECKASGAKEAKNKSERLVSEIDEKLTSIKQYYTVMAESSDLTWVLENDISYSDYSKYKAAMEILAGKTIFSDYIQGYTFVNFKTGWILSNKGMYTTKESSNLKVLQDIFNMKTNNFEKNYWYYDSDNIVYSKLTRDYRVTAETNGLNVVMKLPSSSYETYALVVANVNQLSWKNWILNLIDDNEEVVVVSNDNSVIYSTDASFNEKILALSVNNEKAGFIKNEDNRLFAVGAQSSGILGWKYYVIYDVEGGQPSLRLPVLIILLCLAITFVSYILIGQIIYSPIRSLMKGVTKGEEQVDSNEIDYLAGVLSNQQDKLKELFEIRLLHGEVNEEEWDDYINSLRLDNFEYFATSVIIPQINDDEVQSMVNEDVICLKLLQVMSSEVKSITWMPPIYNASAIFAIFAGDSEEDLLTKIKAFYSKTQLVANEVGEYKMQMGVSATHTSFHHIRAAYRESINALSLKQAENETFEECHFYLSSSTVHNNEYNGKFEEEIKTAVKAVDKEVCYRVTDDFYSFLSKHQGSQEEMQVYILRYANTILKTAIDLGVDIEVIYPNGVRKLYRELLEVAEPARVRRYIKAFFIDPVVDARAEYLKNNSNNLLEQIEKLIVDRHGDITLQECADELGVNQTNIWKVLKMEKGKSFSDYQEEYKLEEAKRLLLETNLTVAEIAEKLNYTNAQNFIRFFNKATGVTPGKFRKLY